MDHLHAATILDSDRCPDLFVSVAQMSAEEIDMRTRLIQNRENPRNHYGLNEMMLEILRDGRSDAYGHACLLAKVFCPEFRFHGKGLTKR